SVKSKSTASRLRERPVTLPARAMFPYTSGTSISAISALGHGRFGGREAGSSEWLAEAPHNRSGLRTVSVGDSHGYPYREPATQRQRRARLEQRMVRARDV